jgi:hypothetical protein
MTAAARQAVVEQGVGSTCEAGIARLHAAMSTQLRMDMAAATVGSVTITGDVAVEQVRAGARSTPTRLTRVARAWRVGAP